MNKYLSRVVSSQRGENFNPLIWPFLLSTLLYGLGFAFLTHNDVVDKSSLYKAMVEILPHAPVIWGLIALTTIICGLTFLLFGIPPAGRLSGLIGFGLWLWACFCWALTGGWLLVGAVGIPNLWFWFWQYLSLSNFRHQEAVDASTLAAYDSGGYDDESKPRESKVNRNNNRGVDRQ